MTHETELSSPTITNNKSFSEKRKYLIGKIDTGLMREYTCEAKSAEEYIGELMQPQIESIYDTMYSLLYYLYNPYSPDAIVVELAGGDVHIACGGGGDLVVLYPSSIPTVFLNHRIFKSEPTVLSEGAAIAMLVSSAAESSTVLQASEFFQLFRG